MAVVISNSHGWLIDSASLINEGLCCCVSEQKRHYRCRFLKQLFEVFKPHIIAKPREDVNCTGLSNSASSLTGEHDTSVELRRRKRKRKHSDLNQGELDAIALHDKIRAVVLEGSCSLVEAGRSCGYFSDIQSVEAGPSTDIHGCCLAALCDMAKDLPLDDSERPPVQAVTGDPRADVQLDLFSRVTENPSNCAKEVMLMGERYFLPPHSRFLLADISRTQPLVSHGERFDLIVLDPPWENKSVKRSNRYSFLPSSQLKQLPVPALSAQGCVVVTWVTNRPRHLRFVREELYPHWGVELLAEWFWVKVTRRGEFVFPVDSPHKKPYEVLLLGRYHGNRDQTTSSKEGLDIPNQKLILSVPSTLHSHKPSLSAVLRPYVRPDASCLEMFARSLQPNWTSWGNEVFKFQHVSYYTTEDLEESHDPSSGSSLSARCHLQSAV